MSSSTNCFKIDGGNQLSKCCTYYNENLTSTYPKVSFGFNSFQSQDFSLAATALMWRKCLFLNSAGGSADCVTLSLKTNHRFSPPPTCFGCDSKRISPTDFFPSVLMRCEGLKGCCCCYFRAFPGLWPVLEMSLRWEAWRCFALIFVSHAIYLYVRSTETCIECL